jgi:dissimilatory sulfite reductase (desulfoviridin) alpha/beta subunit
MVSEADIYGILEKTLLWFRENAYAKERLGAAIDRIGIDSFENSVFSNDLLNRKDEILAKEIMQR